MPYKEFQIEKIYYSIGEVAEFFNVNTSLIRFWESEFEILKPKKSKSGNRQFTKEDINNLKLIYHLVKEKGMTLDGAKSVIKSKKKTVESNLEIIESLQKVKLFLLEIKEQLG